MYIAECWDVTTCNLIGSSLHLEGNKIPFYFSSVLNKEAALFFETLILIHSKRFRRWCIILCGDGFMDFIHRPKKKILKIKITKFRKLALLPSLGEWRGRREHLFSWAPYWASDVGWLCLRGDG
jgi:hypothetical protein